MHRHEDCRQLLDSLSGFHDGDLPQELCDEIELHMKDCDNCRIVVDTLGKTISLYQSSSEEVPVPEDVRQRLYHRLDLDEFLKL
ncbi:MAG: zf-HC2 domain-containing protein [Anaerolineales bacterium]|jgi:anti-sigma factor (TIGR02949 family)|nr:zf-HC2 domain-containing protein [Anaerolineales bacterium]HUV28696.1 zf-HC2 domain-containing protein [Anaerolineales bacterium]